MADTPRNPGADALSAAGAAPLILLSSPVIPVTNGTLTLSGLVSTINVSRGRSNISEHSQWLRY
jgi:hypothetical protein